MIPEYAVVEAIWAAGIWTTIWSFVLYRMGYNAGRNSKQ